MIFLKEKKVIKVKNNEVEFKKCFKMVGVEIKIKIC